MNPVTLHIFHVCEGPGRAQWYWLCDENGKHQLKLRTTIKNQALKEWQEKYPDLIATDKVDHRGFLTHEAAKAQIIRLGQGGLPV